MPKIDCWDDLPPNVRLHLIERMGDRAISLADLSQLRLWVETQPEVPVGIGTKTLALSKFADAARTPKHFCSPAKLPKVKLFNSQRNGPRHF
jgi:hypothetical protein